MDKKITRRDFDYHFGLVKIVLTPNSEIIWSKIPEDNSSITGNLVVRETKVEYNKTPLVGGYIGNDVSDEGIKVKIIGEISVFVPYKAIRTVNFLGYLEGNKVVPPPYKPLTAPNGEK